eukprot:COSAG01_NODE_56993_length_315_cov_0.712963_1_plen_69_part_00
MLGQVTVPVGSNVGLVQFGLYGWRHGPVGIVSFGDDVAFHVSVSAWEPVPAPAPAFFQAEDGIRDRVM